MVAAFLGLPVALEAVVEIAQQLADLRRTDGMVPLRQRRGQGPRTLTRPAEWRLGIAARLWVDQRFQRRHQIRVGHRDRFAPRTWATDAARRHRRAALDLVDPLRDDPPRQAARPMHETDSAKPDGLGFAGGHQAPRALIQQGPHRSEFRRQRGQAHCAAA